MPATQSPKLRHLDRSIDTNLARLVRSIDDRARLTAMKHPQKPCIHCLRSFQYQLQKWREQECLSSGPIKSSP